MTYTREIQIEFNHCDPAGIVFYPRYFEMTNSVIENFFADVVGRSFASMHLGAQKNGVPTARIECDFMAPSRLGDRVLFDLKITRLGSRSVTFAIGGTMAGQLRMRARLTVVWVENLRSAVWPDDMKSRLAAYQETQDEP